MKVYFDSQQTKHTKIKRKRKITAFITWDEAGFWERRAQETFPVSQSQKLNHNKEEVEKVEGKRNSRKTNLGRDNIIRGFVPTELNTGTLLLSPGNLYLDLEHSLQISSDMTISWWLLWELPTVWPQVEVLLDLANCTQYKHLPTWVQLSRLRPVSLLP